MPIKFRCPHCRQFLGISRTKAGEIADCPMCGKSLRVPDLDGTVKPLPKPKLDLEDSSLFDALGELAGIGADDETIDSDFSPPEGAPASPAVRPSAEPIALEPLVPAKPVRAATLAIAPAVSKPKSRTSSAHSSPVDSPEETSDDLLVGAPATAPGVAVRTPARTASRRPTRATQKWPAWWPMASIAGVLLLAAVIFLLTRNADSPRTAAASPAATAADNQTAPNAGTIAPGETGSLPAVTGRVTYLSDAGDTRPDEGARVIALPDTRGGTVKLDVAGFQVGSSDVDVRVATAALRALGGDVDTADEQGQYALRLHQAGSYRLLVISRHQSRPWEVGVESDVQELLDRFFIRPSTLLGQLAYNVQDVPYRGQGTSVRDVAFAKQ